MSRTKNTLNNMVTLEKGVIIKQNKTKNQFFFIEITFSLNEMKVQCYLQMVAFETIQLNK